MKPVIIILIICTSLVYSQELNCHVEVNFENLQVQNRELLADFGSVVESFMNNSKFTEGWDGAKIDCSLSIFFISASSEVDYSAQIVVVSQRPIFQSEMNSPIVTINDGQWSFRYEKGQAMYAGQSTFDALTSFLEFYALIVIGFDWDTWEEFGGNRYFQKAQDIVNLGASSGSSYGWLSSSAPYSRWNLVNDIMSEKYAAFRSTIFDYHYGIDIYQQNKMLGQQKIASLVNTLYDIYQKSGLINSVFIRTFFDAKYGEIIDRMKDYSDPEIFNKLKKIDPPHSSRYDSVMP
jgi:hypothetical protein